MLFMQKARLDHKYIVVTGGTSGLGLAMASALLREGATVAISARPGSRLAACVADLRNQGYQAEALPMDVRDPDSVRSAAQEIGSRWPRLDMVINNAGIGMRTVNLDFLQSPQPFFNVSPRQFDDVIATNLTGYFLVSREFFSLFEKQNAGRFLNISMNHETMVRQGFVPYGPSRAGAEALSYIMAKDLEPFGVTVNILLPGGAVKTGMIPENVQESVRSRLLDPEIMGPPVVFLASDEAKGITGERITATLWHEWCRSHGIVPRDS